MLEQSTACNCWPARSSSWRSVMNMRVWPTGGPLRLHSLVAPGTVHVLLLPVAGLECATSDEELISNETNAYDVVSDHAPPETVVRWCVTHNEDSVAVLVHARVDNMPLPLEPHAVYKRVCESQNYDLPHRECAFNIDELRALLWYIVSRPKEGDVGGTARLSLLRGFQRLQAVIPQKTGLKRSRHADEIRVAGSIAYSNKSDLSNHDVENYLDNDNDDDDEYASTTNKIMTPCLSLPTLPGLPKSAPLLSPGVSPLLKRQNSLRPLNLGQLNIEDTEFSLVREECRVATAVLSRVRDYLYVGGVESASLDSSTFRKHNIVTVVNLAAGAIENNVHVDGVKIVRVYSRDSEAEDATALIPIVALEVADAKRRKGAVLIHCHRGISRSCAMATAVLMLEEKADAGWALSELRIARPVASPNPGFVRALQTLQAAIHGEPNRRIAVLARLKGDPGDGVEVLVETNKAQMASNRRAWAALVVERGNSDGVLAVRGPLVHERRWRKTLRLARWIVERNGLVGGNSHARGNTLDVAMMRDDSTLLHD